MDAALATPFTIPLEFMGYPREAPFLPIFIKLLHPAQPSGSVAIVSVRRSTM